VSPRKVEVMAKMMRIREAADYVGVSDASLRRWVKRGHIEVMRSPDNRWFWTREMLDDVTKGMRTRFGAKARA
jgi:excisionase family DNA binding protein